MTEAADHLRDAVGYARALSRGDIDAARTFTRGVDDPRPLIPALAALLMGQVRTVADLQGVSVDEVWDRMLAAGEGFRGRPGSAAE